ncbi:hypothetical protein ACHAWF_005743 [Thalassiosira exigua]
MATFAPIFAHRLRRKLNTTALLPVLLAAAILLLVSLMIRSQPSMGYPSQYGSIWTLQQNVTEHRRVLTVFVVEENHRQHITAQFRLTNGSHHTHSSKPYFTRVDIGTGEYVQAIEYDRDHHPLKSLVDLREPGDVKREAAFFFVVPKGNGGKMKAIMTNCYKLRRAEKRKDPESLTFIKGVLNIDTQTRQGLARARSNNIIDSGLVDVFATSYFYEGMLLFKPQYRGRAFTILRHPVYRAESLYRSRNPNKKYEGLPGYLESEDYIDNWMVRSLTNDKTGTLSEGHLAVARGILARKFLVGIAEHFEETIKRLAIYFGWDESHNEGCVSNYLNNERLKEEDSALVRGSPEWNLITEKDHYDLMLYYFALELFAKQASTMFNRPYVDQSGKPIDFREIRRKREEKMNKMMGFLAT